MKKIIAALLLIATCALAQVDSNEDRYFHAHRGFYFSINSGAFYTYVRHTLHDATYNGLEKSTGSFTGFLNYDEIRLGGSIANKASIFAAIGFGYGSGTFSEDMECAECSNDKEGSFEEDDNEDIRFLFGIGGEFYPIQDQGSPIYGLFFGLTAGLVLDIISFTDHSYNTVYEDELTNTTYGNFVIRFEVGKDWWIGRRWSFGVALNYTYGSFSDEFGNESTYGDSYEEKFYLEDEESFTNHTFGLTLRLSH